MGLNVENLVNNMEKIYKDIIVQERVENLNNFKLTLLDKRNKLDIYINKIEKVSYGNITKKYLRELYKIKSNFDTLYENFDDKLMIFIIGNGNVGKSTLLNSLIGEEVAVVNFLPSTWKIDIYSPELRKDRALIKDVNEGWKTLNINEVKRIVDEEEKKSKDARKIYRENLNKRLKGINIKEERDEITKYLSEKYLYKSKITEVKWPVKKNWMLEKCLLVDTPGLNQDLYQIEQMGDIKDYYHKADGVLWLLDGQSIVSKSIKESIKELDELLNNVGGIRNNIIGVVNRIDQVRNNGGEKAVLDVLNEAKRIYGEKFCNIIGISAKEASDAIIKNNIEKLHISGILELQNAIREIFISKAENIKSSAKLQGSNKLIFMLSEEIVRFLNNIENYKNMYLRKGEEVKNLKKKLINNFDEDIEYFFKSYLNEVEVRTNNYVNELANGKGIDFIKNKIYKLSDLKKEIEKFNSNKILEIKNNSDIWTSLCDISEYKYIKNTQINVEQNIRVGNNLNFDKLNSIEGFTPNIEKDLFDFLGNLIGKFSFFLRKSKIKNIINENISTECEKVKSELKEELGRKIERVFTACNKVLDDSFRNILFDFNCIDKVVDYTEELDCEIKKEREDIKLKEIIL